MPVDHIPVLLVLVPLMAAPVIVLLRRPPLVLGIVGLVGALQVMMTLTLLSDVLVAGALSYPVGGWAPPWGIELRVDTLNAIILLLLAIITAIVLPYMFISCRQEISEDKTHLFYALVLLSLAGMTGMTVTGDAFNVFVFLEIAALSSYGLISLGRDRRALTAAFRYLLIGTTGSTFFLLGLGFLLMATGTLNMVDVADRLYEIGPNRTVLAAMAFITIGIGLKLAMFPMHFWLPDAYAYAPHGVSCLIAATSTKVSFYVFCRFIYTVFGAELTYDHLHLEAALLPVAVAGILAASLAAIFEHNLKRILAFSSVAQLGYMLLGLGLDNEAGLTGSLVHTFNHAVMKGALFMAVGGLAYRLGSTELSALRGAAKRMPWSAAAFVVGGLSLVGVPLTVGFISKWYLVLGALENQQYWIVAVLLGGSLLAVVYVGRVVEVLYFGQPTQSDTDEGEGINDMPPGMLVPTWILAGLAVGFGIATTTTVGIAQMAASGLGIF